MKHLIVGKNSRIVKFLQLPSNFEKISSIDLQFVDFDQYDHVWIFSWSNKCLNDNINLIRLIPIKKIIFVSSHSVHSNSIAKQPYNYVNWKIKCENLVKCGGGKILRIASIDFNIAKFYNNVFAHTKIEDLQNFMINFNSFDKSIIFELFDINISDKEKNYFLRSIIQLTNFLRTHKAINLLHASFFKLSKLYSYGYGRDSQYVLADKLIIGFGAIGSFALNNKITSKDIIIRSDSKNYKINSNGFYRMLIGKTKHGLSELWHGVETYKTDNNRVKKKVAIFPHRPKSSFGKRFVEGTVDKISYKKNKWEISVIKNDGNEFKYFSNKLILSAGWLENTRLLSALVSKKLEVKFSDDESMVIGSIALSEAIEHGLVKKVGPFLKNGTGIILDGQGKEFIEARISVITPKQDYDLYYMSTFSVIKQIILSLNFSKINSAFFNKFGWCIKSSKHLDLFLTILAPKSINCIFENGRLIRISKTSLLKKVFKNLSFKLSRKFTTFKINQGRIIFDGLHVTGGYEFLKYEPLKTYLKNSTLFVLGPPNQNKENAFHTTKRLQLDARQKVKDLL